MAAMTTGRIIRSDRPRCWLLLVLTWVVMAVVQAQAETAGRGQRHKVFSVNDIRNRLEAIAPLQLRTHDAGDGTIKSQVLCFCLHKGPHMVRELRRQAAVHFQKGVDALQAHDGGTAARAFTKAIELHPRDALAYMNRGLAYSQTGDFMKAHSDLTRAVEIDSGQSVTYYARALVSLLLGQETKAERDLRQAKDLGETRACAVLEMLLATSGTRGKNGKPS